METLLLIEDDKFTRHFIREQLEAHDVVVLEAISGKRSLEILDQHHVDLILLDIGLPDGNGLDFIPEIRKRSDVPLIIVSAEKDVSNRIDGLKRGADDFVPKPFSAGELLARIEANLRRYREPHPVISPSGLHNESKIFFHNWVLEPDKFQIFNQNGQSGDLTIREYKVLEMLIRNAGRVISREDLCKAVREDNYIPTSRAMDVKITRIRKKIGDDAGDPQIIKTIRGVGYMFDQGVVD